MTEVGSNCWISVIVSVGLWMEPNPSPGTMPTICVVRPREDNWPMCSTKGYSVSKYMICNISCHFKIRFSHVSNQKENVREKEGISFIAAAG